MPAPALALNPSFTSVGQLFGNNMVFRVPKYQRYYAWTSEETEDFLSDIEACRAARHAGAPKHHFFGGVVTVNKPHPGSGRQNLEVIDGQQRLASFVLLMARLKTRMARLAGEVDKTLQSSPHQFLIAKSSALRDQYEVYKDTINLQVVDVARLELSKPDKIFFAQLVAGANPQKTRQSHVLLENAAKRMDEYLDFVVESEVDDSSKANALALVAEVVQQDLSILHMLSPSTDLAYMLFQVLNDRGISLTEGELLRSRTLEVLDSCGTAGQQEAVEQDWDVILGFEPSTVEDGLRWLYASYAGKRPGKTTLLDEFLKEILPTCWKEPFTQNGAGTAVTRVAALREEFEKLSKILQGEWPYVAHPSVTAWDRNRLRLLIVELKHTNCMPLLIAALCLDQPKFSELVQLLERFVFRYKHVVNAHISRATDLYHQEALKIRADPGKYDVKSVRLKLATLIHTHAADDVFRARLSELRYSTSASNKTVKYFLMTLEDYAAWYDKGAHGRPKCLSKNVVLDFSNTTVEHVYPQNSASPDPAMNAVVHRLGNLTILGPGDNDAAGNKPFAAKKAILEQSTITLNKKIAQSATWDSAAVAAWEANVINAGVKVFSI